MKSYLVKLVILLALIINTVSCQETEIEEASTGLHQIEGKIFSPEIGDNFKWTQETQVIASNGVTGEFRGFLKADGTFTINKISSGSYIIDVVNADYFYEPIRVEINSKGKIRARKVNHIQPSQVIQLAYPLKIKALTNFRYFQTREQWKVTDFMFSPMVLMMILPLILLVLLPKILNDPEAKKEMDNLQLPKMGELPDMSEMISRLMGGGGAAPQQRQAQPAAASGERVRNKKRSSNNN